MHRRTCAFLVLLCWLSPVLAVPEDWPVPRGPAREPDPYRLDRAALQRVPRAFLDDAAACILYASTTHLIEPDGTVETIVHEVTRLNSRKGIEKLGEHRHITYDPATQKITLNEARVIKPDGKSLPVEPRHVQLRDVGTDYSVYDQDKQLVISFPNLQVGDLIEVKWTTRGRNPSFEGRYFGRYSFGDVDNPVVRDELRICLPSAMPLHWAAVNGKLEPTLCEQQGQRLYRWVVTNHPPLPQDSDLPPREELRLQVAYSTYPSWEEVGRWKQRLRKDCWECTPAIRKVVREVTHGLSSPLDKARALTTWVRQNIRYHSMMTARGGYLPQLPARTLANLYGDCKDQSQLLAVMLREAGFKVELVTLGSHGDGQIVKEVPSPWGTHAMLLVHIAGQEHWIDTTSTLAGWDFLPRADRDRVCYLTDDQGRLRLHRTPPLSYATNRFEQVTQVQVQPDGSVRCRRGISYHGSAAIVQREAWVDAPPGERRRLMTAELQDANSRSRLLRLDVDERRLRDLERPVEAQLEYEIPGHFTGQLEKEGSFTDSKVWGRLLAYNLDPDRQAPLDLWAPFESIHRYLIHLPPAFRFDGLPRDKEVQSRWGWLKLRIRPDPRNPRLLEVEFHTRLEKTRVEPAHFAEFRRFHQEVYRAWRVWINLTPTTDPADILALEASLAAAPQDHTTAAVLAKLYQKQRRPADCQRVLEHALRYHPEDRSLWDQLVQATDTLEQEEAVLQAMIRRYPQDLQLRLDLATTRIQLGKHDEASALLLKLLGEAGPALRARASYQLARSAAARQQPARALEHLQAARRVDPQSINNVSAWEFQGQVHEQLGQKAEALQAWRQALQLQPDRVQAMAAVLRLECAGQPTPATFDLLRRYTLAVGNNLEGLVQAADFALQLGRLDDALELASRSRDIDFHAGTQRVLGLVHFRRGQYERAVFHLERAEPDADVLAALLHSHLALGRLGQAVALVGTAEKFRAGHATLPKLLTTVAALERRKAALLTGVEKPASWRETFPPAVDRLVCAEHALAEGLPLERVEQILGPPDDVPLGGLHALRGQLALEKGRLSRALEEAERAIRLSPAEWRGYYIRGRVRLERGDHLALPDLLRAVELSERREPTVLHWLAQAQFQAGRFSEALTTQARAVQLQPGNRELLEQLRRFEELVPRK